MENSTKAEAEKSQRRKRRVSRWDEGEKDSNRSYNNGDNVKRNKSRFSRELLQEEEAHAPPRNDTEAGEFDHCGMLVVNEIAMLDGSVRRFYSLPPDYPMPPDFRLVFPPEYAPAPPPPPADGCGGVVFPGPDSAWTSGYQPQYVVGAVDNGVVGARREEAQKQGGGNHRRKHGGK